MIKVVIPESINNMPSNADKYFIIAYKYDKFCHISKEKMGGRDEIL